MGFPPGPEGQSHCGDALSLLELPLAASPTGGKKKGFPATASWVPTAGPGPYHHPGAASPTHAPWFDVRVVYLRVTSCTLQDESSSPEVLHFRCPPRGIGTALEVNGARISPGEAAVLALRRDRADPERAEATYVSTDNLRAGGAVAFEVLHQDEQLLCGLLQRGGGESPTAGAAGAGGPCSRQDWTLHCACTVGAGGCVFLKGRHDYSATSPLAQPAAEVCIVGRAGAGPAILAQTVALTARRRNVRQVALDAIPEAEEGERGQLAASAGGSGSGPPLSGDEAGPSPRLGSLERLAAYQEKPLAAAYGGGFYESLEGAAYGESDEAGEMSWFNAGVRVGVGLGLGMCLGVGIGVGLLVRTYQTTARSFRRRLW